MSLECTSKNKERMWSNFGFSKYKEEFSYVVYIRLPWVYDNHKEYGKNENFKPGLISYMSTNFKSQTCYMWYL